MKKRARIKYEWYRALAKDERARPLDFRASFDPNGPSGIMAFHILESEGRVVPTKEPLEFELFTVGKKLHGLTVEMAAEDFAISRILMANEIKSLYPDWVANEIFSQAEKIALNKIGFVPSFIRNRKDYSDHIETTPVAQQIPPKSRKSQ